MSKHKVINATFLHPFTCIISGPSGCGKTTFVRDLIENRERLVTGKWRYIFVYIGTKTMENPILKAVQESFPDLVKIFEVANLYEGNQQVFEEKFASDFCQLIQNVGPNGLVVFDDLMLLLSRANLLTDLFSKIFLASKFKRDSYYSKSFFERQASTRA